ncbi:MAG: putative amino acid transporter, periplasmic amino acid-binding protein, partial [Conexibacter sp.]|nr:putative amino acid transporter, periplasmic amino acid-binding protein [Conexibacter sp.]
GGTLVCLAALSLAVFGCGSDDDASSSASSTAASSSCTPKVDLPTIKKGVLTVVGPVYPPLFTYSNGQPGGVEGEQLKQIAKDACLKLKVTIQPAAGVISSVQAKRADVAAGGWYASAARAKIVGQTEPNYTDPPMLVSKEGYDSIEQVKGKTIGTTQGYIWEADLKKFAGSKAKFFQSPDAVFSDLQAGRIDVALMALNEGGYRIKKNPDSGLKGGILKSTPIIGASQSIEATNYPHIKDKPAVTAALNKEIESMRASGLTAKLLEQAGLDPSAANPKTS